MRVRSALWWWVGCTFIIMGVVVATSVTECYKECNSVDSRYSSVACFVDGNGTRTTFVNRRCVGSSGVDLFTCLVDSANQTILWAGNCSAPLSAPYTPAEWSPLPVPLLLDTEVPRFVDGSSYETHPLLDRSVLSQIWLEMEEVDWMRIARNELQGKTYAPCTYEFVLKGGNRVRGSGGVRRHGLTSRGEIQPALHLKFGKSIHSMHKLTFKTTQRDPTTGRELACLDNFYGLNVAGQRGSLYEVFLNGRLVSEYVALEEIDQEAFFKARFGVPASGGLSKCAIDFESYLNCDDENVTQDLSTVLGYVASKNLTALEASVDLEGFLRVWASNVMTSNTDWVNNAYLYRFNQSDRWHYMRYDNDFSFEVESKVSVFTWGQTLHRGGLASFLLSIPSYRDRYKELIGTIAKANTTLSWLTNHKWAAPAVARDGWFGMQYHFNVADFDHSLTSNITLPGLMTLQAVLLFLQDRSTSALQEINQLI